MNSVSYGALQLHRKKMFPEKVVFIRRLPELDEELFGFVHTVYQAVDEFGAVKQSYGGDAEFAFKTAREDHFQPYWVQ